ncbi:MAG: LPS export ABC transporter periplasmic protein LptC [Burkholderiaceae bacterium]
MGSFRQAWDRVTIYLPVILMALLALGTWWTVRNTPLFTAPEPEAAPRHEPDYFMRGFSVKTFDGTGRLKSEIFGAEARHYPDTDTLEIDQVRMRSINKEGRLTTATANRALSNGDGSGVQLFGNAIVVRDEARDANGQIVQRLEFRGEFLHAFIDTERVKSHLPVELMRGTDRFTADTLAYDNLDRVADLKGRVRGVLTPGAAQSNP